MVRSLSQFSNFCLTSQAHGYYWGHHLHYCDLLLVCTISCNHIIVSNPYIPRFSLFFPDSPTNAWFLTPQERAVAVMRLKENQTGVENKHFKKEQCVSSDNDDDLIELNLLRMIEALLDPKTWMFALFSALDNVPNSLTNQQALIVASFGFTNLQTTLLNTVSGFVEIITIWTGVNIAARYPNRWVGS